MGLIGQNQQTSFTSPANGESPIDGDVVRTNDNALVTKHNAHDADATIHVQTGTLASRPAAGTAYALYVDENRRVYVDNGSAWTEVPYIRASTTVTGDITFTGTITAGTAFSGSGASLTSIPQSAVTNLTSDLAGKASTSHSHNLQDLGGAVTNAQMPTTITGRTSVSSEQFKGVTNAGNIIDLQNTASRFITITNGATFSVTNNASASTPSTVGPTGKTTHAASDRFWIVKDEATGDDYYLRLERWT